MTHKLYITRNKISKQNIFTILYKASGFWKNKPTKYQFLPYNILYIKVIMYKMNLYSLMFYTISMTILDEI